eukprot:300611-Rhodomonas_salina.1
MVTVQETSELSDGSLTGRCTWSLESSATQALRSNFLVAAQPNMLSHSHTPKTETNSDGETNTKTCTTSALQSATATAPPLATESATACVKPASPKSLPLIAACAPPQAKTTDSAQQGHNPFQPSIHSRKETRGHSCSPSRDWKNRLESIAANC